MAKRSSLHSRQSDSRRAKTNSIHYSYLVAAALQAHPSLFPTACRRVSSTSSALINLITNRRTDPPTCLPNTPDLLLAFAPRPWEILIRKQADYLMVWCENQRKQMWNDSKDSTNKTRFHHWIVGMTIPMLYLFRNVTSTHCRMFEAHCRQDKCLYQWAPDAHWKSILRGQPMSMIHDVTFNSHWM